MPADPLSVLILILLNAADAVWRLGFYVLGGVVVAMLASWILWRRSWVALSRVPRPLITPLASAMGVVSPLPTTSVVPLVVWLREKGLPASSALAFILASSLMNPQLFLLTLGALGTKFALIQLGSVLVLSIGAGLVFAGEKDRALSAQTNEMPLESEQRVGLWARSVGLTGHVAAHFLVGVLIGSALQVLLPSLGLLDWMSSRGLLSTPILGWLGAPLYGCGGSAIPLARSLMLAGFSPGTLFSFLLIGPALRGTTLASLGCLLSKRALLICLVMLALAGGLLGYGFNWLAGAF